VFLKVSLFKLDFLYSCEPDDNRSALTRFWGKYNGTFSRRDVVFGVDDNDVLCRWSLGYYAYIVRM